jgi:hypothetical protein
MTGIQTDREAIVLSNLRHAAKRIEDMYSWTEAGLPRRHRRREFWDMVQSEWRMEWEMREDERSHERREFFSAIRMLLTTWLADTDDRTVRAIWLKVGCLFAILLGRSGIRDGFPFEDSRYRYHDYDMGHWDYVRSGIGWDCSTLHFHPRQFRYQIGTDGDCYL